MGDLRRLKITIQEGKKKPQTVLDIGVLAATVNVRRDWEEIRSNQALATAMGGAPVEVWKDLPGEQVAIHTRGQEIEVTYTMRFYAPKGHLSEFRDAFPA